MIRYCEACGTKVRPNARFCFHCGHELEPDEFTAYSEDSCLLNSDTSLDFFFVDGFAGGQPVGICEEIKYCHKDRSLLSIGFSTTGVSHHDVLLTSIPDDICTVNELIDYAKARGVRFWNL